MVLHIAFSLVGTTEKIIFLLHWSVCLVYGWDICVLLNSILRKRKSLQVKVQTKKVTQPKKGTQPAKEETSSSDESSSDDVSIIYFLLGTSFIPIHTYVVFI